MDKLFMYELAIFVLGFWVSFWLIPRMEKRKQDFIRSESEINLFLELKDIKQQLEEHIKICFECLHSLIVEPNKVNWGIIPIPSNLILDVDYLIDSYKVSSPKLTLDQRLAIKSIPNGIGECRDVLKVIECNIPMETIDNITALKASTQIACSLVFEINRLDMERDRFKRPSKTEFFENTRQVLKTLGYTDSQINVSRIDTADCIVEPIQ